MSGAVAMVERKWGRTYEGLFFFSNDAETLLLLLVSFLSIQLGQRYIFGTHFDNASGTREDASIK